MQKFKLKKIAQIKSDIISQPLFSDDGFRYSIFVYQFSLSVSVVYRTDCFDVRVLRDNHYPVVVASISCPAELAEVIFKHFFS